MASKHFVDSHFHIWDLEKFQYPWPTEDSPVLYRNYLIEELVTDVRHSPVQYGVFIQVLNNKPQEAEWVMSLAEKYSFIKGVVGGLDLTSPKLEVTLDMMQKSPLFKGVRHIIDFEKDLEGWLTRDDVRQGLKILETRGLTFDLLLRPPLLKYIPALATEFPRLKMVVNHIAKPLVKDKIFAGWKDEMAAVAECPNVYCKLSGLVSEADWKWTVDDFKPYVDHVVESFGVERCMFGSDWPVCNVGKLSYKDACELISKLLPALTDDEKILVFRENAIKFYNLTDV